MPADAPVHRRTKCTNSAIRSFLYSCQLDCDRHVSIVYAQMSLMARCLNENTIATGLIKIWLYKIAYSTKLGKKTLKVTLRTIA